MVLRALAEADKSIAFFPGWSKPDQDDSYSYFLASLSIGGVTEAGLFLSGGTYANLPDRHVTFEVVWLYGGGAKRMKLMRIDWRSIRGGHTNSRRHKCLGCPKRASDTHFHSFEVNWDDDRNRLRGQKLPCALDISEQLQSFEALRAYVGKHFRINNIDVVTPPEWEYKLEL
jgi:hypothetical protein